MNKALNALNTTTERQVLVMLFDFARRDVHATVIRLVQAIGSDRQSVEAALERLDAHGLVDRDKVRLSMQGLATAMFLGAPVLQRKSSGAPKVATKRAA